VSEEDRAIMAAVASLRPGAGWNFSYGQGLSGLAWLDSKIARPSDAEIQAEMARLAALPAASVKLEQHLTAAIEEFSAKIEGKPKMRGLARLAELVENGMKELDDDADKAVEEFLEAKAKGKEALGNFRSHTAEVRKKIDDALQQLGRISNMDPTQGSGGSSGSATSG